MTTTTTTTTATASCWAHGSALAAAENAFTALTTGPAPLSLDCAGLPETADPRAAALPAGRVALPRVRQWLLEHAFEYAVADEIWRRLILAARLDGPAWVVAAVGVAIPALAGMSRQLRSRFPDADPADIDAELLTGFLEQVRDRLDRDSTGLLPSLRMAAWRSAWRMLTRDGDTEPLDEIHHAAAMSQAPRPMASHPDLLVARAVELGVLDAADAGAWIDIRLGRRAPEPHAVRMGITVDALRMRLARADQALLSALRAGTLTDRIGPAERARLTRAAAARTALRQRHTAAAATAARIAGLLRAAAA